jgi:hypothetical protein
LIYLDINNWKSTIYYDSNKGIAVKSETVFGRFIEGFGQEGIVVAQFLEFEEFQEEEQEGQGEVREECFSLVWR